MVFRAAAGIATLLIGLNSQGVAQYYPPPQAYPRLIPFLCQPPLGEGPPLFASVAVTARLGAILVIAS